MDGLAHSIMNARDRLKPGACFCCNDCCEDWTSLIKNGVSIGHRWAKSRYEPVIDPQLCNADECATNQKCVTSCEFGAISLRSVGGKDVAVVDSEKCWGCASCWYWCEAKAIKMVTVRPPEWIPETEERRLFMDDGPPEGIRVVT